MGSKSTTTLVLSLAAFVFFLIAATYFDSFYAFLTDESQGVEILTAIFYICGGVVLIRTGYPIVKSGKFFDAAFIFLLGAFFIFVGGEEESWGQWIFNFSTPQQLSDINYQQEVNIHNLDFFSGAFSAHTILNLFVIVYGILIPVLYASLDKLKIFLDNIRFPVIPQHLISIFIIGFIYEKVLYRTDASEAWRHTEVTEFFFATGFLSFCIFYFSSRDRSPV